MQKTPLEFWVAGKIKPRHTGTGAPGEPLTRQEIEDYQLRKLQETLACENPQPLLSKSPGRPHPGAGFLPGFFPHPVYYGRRAEAGS